MSDFGFELIDVSEVVVRARRVKLPVEVEAIRSACHLADVIQDAVAKKAMPGVSEVELAADAHAAACREAGSRIPAIVTVTTGPETANAGWESTGRVVEPGDLVLTDTSPWYRGAWADTANTVVVGTPTREHLRVFEAVKKALDLAIDLCRPGIEAAEIDEKVRETLEPFGPTYPHHTGHGIGASWSEPPFITPFETLRIEEGMTLALEPGIYRPGWGGMRLEHVIRVNRAGNEILSEFDHRLVSAG